MLRILGQAASPIDLWREITYDVRGEALASGHFLAEEAPEATLASMLRFLARGAA